MTDREGSGADCTSPKDEMKSHRQTYSSSGQGSPTQLEGEETGNGLIGDGAVSTENWRENTLYSASSLLSTECLDGAPDGENITGEAQITDELTELAAAAAESESHDASTGNGSGMAAGSGEPSTSQSELVQRVALGTGNEPAKLERRQGDSAQVRTLCLSAVNHAHMSIHRRAVTDPVPCATQDSKVKVQSSLLVRVSEETGPMTQPDEQRHTHFPTNNESGVTNSADSMLKTERNEIRVSPVAETDGKVEFSQPTEADKAAGKSSSNNIRKRTQKKRHKQRGMAERHTEKWAEQKVGREREEEEESVMSWRQWTVGQLAELLQLKDRQLEAMRASCHRLWRQNSKLHSSDQQLRRQLHELREYRPHTDSPVDTPTGSCSSCSRLQQQLRSCQTDIWSLQQNIRQLAEGSSRLQSANDHLSEQHRHSHQRLQLVSRQLQLSRRAVAHWRADSGARAEQLQLLEKQLQAVQQLNYSRGNTAGAREARRTISVAINTGDLTSQPIATPAAAASSSSEPAADTCPPQPPAATAAEEQTVIQPITVSI